MTVYYAFQENPWKQEAGLLDQTSIELSVPKPQPGADNWGGNYPETTCCFDKKGRRNPAIL
jgi:hypothetical protein